MMEGFLSIANQIFDQIGYPVCELIFGHPSNPIGTLFLLHPV